ncbi:alpha/beta hydrolase family protein [Alloalcanivorax mobilis]|uniref:alpha/beta hydrolase family protein n=1 Tax=Alloalcanivorax mobilis TaxID=2019569 RepID=UPI000B5B247F|nr:alpha/beta hydrolase [Alloalcanivorax mobilis]ASK35936.1 alpha/beta hydrolase [Alcanivorax sp. N3-2A]|tara:strand:- start:93307 stop:95079 length:1773 start_codon:yes stop_codon:yes gene_type:complete
MSMFHTLSAPRALGAFWFATCLGLTACGGDSSHHDSGEEAKTTPDSVYSGTAADPADMGDFAVAHEEYDFGRMTLNDEKNGDSYESTIHGYIEYPEDQAGPFPVVLILHGRHGTCYSGGRDPDTCADPIPSFEGYEYITENLASHGYAVLSIDANYVNANDSSPGNGDTGALARAQLIYRHLDEFRTINASGGNGFDALVGKLNFDKVGIMGHSRGGEGVDRAVLYNRNQPEPINITAVFAMAPTDYNTLTVSNVAFTALAGYCDGDVEDLMGNYAFDTSRYAVANDPYPKFQLIPMGANHNYYNTVWTDDSRPDDWTILDSDGDDPWCGENAAGNGRDTPELQRAQGLFFVASFFRYFVGGEQEYASYWSGQASVPDSICPNGAPCDDRYLLSVHAPAEDRLVVDDTLDPASLTTNNLGGAVTFDGFSNFGICQTNGRPGEGCDVATPTFNTAEQLFMAWDTTATYRTELLDQDVTDFQVVTLRVGISHGDLDNEAGQDFHIVLEDMDGNRVAVAADDYSDALFFPPGRAFYDDTNHGSQKTTLNAVDIPLTAFDGIDYQHVKALEVVFDQTPAGTIQLTDVMFQRVDF